jgi:hypothetical protein
MALQEAAREQFSIPEEHASKCYRCSEKWPELIGDVDEAADAEPKPLHLRCSRTHSLAAPEPFYEERRVMLEQ